MPTNSKLANYRPRPEHCALVLAKGGQPWAVYLSPLANVIDLAVIMNGLGVEVVARRGELTNGVLVVPTDPATPAPSHAKFRDILERGFDAGELPQPLMFRRQAQ